MHAGKHNYLSIFLGRGNFGQAVTVTDMVAEFNHLETLVVMCEDTQFSPQPGFCILDPLSQFGGPGLTVLLWQREIHVYDRSFFFAFIWANFC